MKELGLGIQHLEIEQLEERIAPSLCDPCGGGSLINVSPNIYADNVNVVTQVNVVGNNYSYNYQYSYN